MKRVVFLSAIALLFCISASQVSASPAWNAFNPATFTDIYLSPMFSDGVTYYTLSIGTNPTITFDGNTYNVNWLQSVYAVGKTSSTTFIATEGTRPSVGVYEWDYDTKNAGNGRVVVAGYVGQGEKERISAGESITFTFNDFHLDNLSDVVLGFHAGYGNQGYTAAFKETTVPEPSSLAALIAPLAGLLVIKRKRK